MHEATQVLYLHLGHQCPGYFMEKEGRKLADLLGARFSSYDLTKHPELARRHAVFWPGTIVVDGFFLPYPAPAERLLEAYRRQGPLPGGRSAYREKPPGSVDEIIPLGPDNAHLAVAFCSAVPPNGEGWSALVKRKAGWLEQVGEYLSARFASRGSLAAGYIGLCGGKPLGVVEVVPEADLPYPVPDKREDGLYITCLYGEKSQLDYRGVVLAELLRKATRAGVSRITVAAGERYPYPNGPCPLFAAHGFQRGPYLTNALLKGAEDRVYLMTWEAGSSD